MTAAVVLDGLQGLLGLMRPQAEVVIVSEPCAFEQQLMVHIASLNEDICPTSVASHTERLVSLPLAP